MKIIIGIIAIVVIAGGAVMVTGKESDSEITTDAERTTITDDHHAGETNVEPHGHDEDTVEPHDDSGQPPHTHEGVEDHHDGETNVEPHGHDDEEGVEPHDDSDQPPHRHN